MGIDDISYIMLKLLIEYLVGPMTRIANATTLFNHHPASAKKVVIKPLHKGKKKEHDDPRSYRPVSLLPVIGRIWRA